MAGLLRPSGLLSHLPAGLIASQTIAGGAWRGPEPLRIDISPVSAAEAAHQAALRLHGLNPRIAMPGIRRAPSYRPSRTRIFAHTPEQTREQRRLVMVARAADRGRLAASDRAFIAECIKWRREFTIEEGDRIAEIAERAFWIERDGVAA